MKFRTILFILSIFGTPGKIAEVCHLRVREEGGPSSHKPKHQQCGLRHSAPGFAGSQFIPAMDQKRQRAGKQEPHQKRVGKRCAAQCC